MKFELIASFALILGLFAFCMGCGSDEVAAGFKKANGLNIQKVSNAYRMFASVNNNQGPENEDEFKSFLRSDERIAPRLGLTSSDLTERLDDYFISEVDGEPLVVLYGQAIRPDLDYSAIAFDKTGKDGVRRIALACNVIIEVSDQKKYERILAGKIKKSDVPAHVFGGPIEKVLEESEN